MEIPEAEAEVPEPKPAEADTITFGTRASITVPTRLPQGTDGLRSPVRLARLLRAVRAAVRQADEIGTIGADIREDGRLSTIVKHFPEETGEISDKRAEAEPRTTGITKPPPTTTTADRVGRPAPLPLETEILVGQWREPATVRSISAIHSFNQTCEFFSFPPFRLRA